MTDWDDTFAFVLGNEAGGNGLFEGTIRMAAMHKFALTPEQIQQNFDVGVGEKFFLLFSVEDIISHPTAYVLFEVRSLIHTPMSSRSRTSLRSTAAFQQRTFPSRECVLASMVLR